MDAKYHDDAVALLLAAMEVSYVERVVQNRKLEALLAEAASWDGLTSFEAR